MKRTPPWVWVAAAAVQLAALGAALWAMERREPLAVEPSLALAPPAPPVPPETVAAPAPAAAPLLGAPPPSAGPSRFVAQAIAASAQVLEGRCAAGAILVALFPDGELEIVDGDGARYAGTTENARARMREAGGTRAFTVQLGLHQNGALRATFTGGAHDGETIALAPAVESVE